MTTTAVPVSVWRRLGVAAAVSCLASTAACASTSAESRSDDTPTAGGQQAAAVAIKDPWVKAADTGMTAAFGTLTNDSDRAVRVVAAASASTTSMELHEMATDDSGAMIMREKKGGLVIPAGGTHKLDPGGDHLMLMDVTDPVRAGADVTITLKLQDGSRTTFTAPARTFSGADEDYRGDSESQSDE